MTDTTLFLDSNGVAKGNANTSDPFGTSNIDTFKISNRLDVNTSGLVQVYRSLQVNKNQTVSGNSQVFGTQYVQDHLTTDRNLYVSGNTFISGKVQINGNATVAKNVQVNGNTAIAGSLSIAQVQETVAIKTGATGVVTHDWTTGAVFYHSSISANFTVNFTNVPTTADKAYGVTLILNQGSTGYYPNVLQVNGNAVTIKWANNVTPVPSANKLDMVSFTLVYTGSTWYALGQFTNFA